MSDSQLIRIQEMVRELKEVHTDEELAELKLEETAHLSSNLKKQSDSCQTCQKYLDVLESDLTTWTSNGDISLQQEEHKKNLDESRLHLKKEHNMVDENTGFGLGISLGLSIGTALGLLVFKNIAIGIAVGIAIGVGVGAGIDESYKKEGRVL